mmetsp:Transcript_26585/g.34937  ORF Transcript_26585/g.34937 Transcript_26585/m.34937 type:complete len:775 (+) Transcript_26585:199-2523(+)
MSKENKGDSAVDLLEAIRKGLEKKGVNPGAALQRAVLGEQESSFGGDSKEGGDSGGTSEAEEVSSEDEDGSEEESETEDDEEEEESTEEESEEESEEDEDEDEESEGDDEEEDRDSEVRVKLTLDDEVRAVRLPVQITLPALNEQIKRDYGAEMEISYMDAEGDKVSIRTQEDLLLALKLQSDKEEEEETCPSLRLILERAEIKMDGGASPLDISAKRPPTGMRRTRRPQSSGLGVGAVQSPIKTRGGGRNPMAESFAVVDLDRVEECRPSEFGRFDFQTLGQDMYSSMQFSSTQGAYSVSPRRSRMSKTSAYVRSNPDINGTRPLTGGVYTGMRTTATPLKFSNTTLVQPYGFMDTLSGEEKSGDGPLLWQKGNLIGQGSFGKVYAALDLRSGRQLAVKQMKFSKGKESKAQVRMLRKEIALMEKLTHPNIILYLGTQQIGNKLNIFLEFASEGSLMQAIQRFGCFRESVVRQYCCQILDGLIYLHSQGIIHRDIKPSNILMDKGIVKLADFGCSIGIDLKEGDKSEAAHQYTAVGTTTYMAPEVMQADIEAGAGYGRKADIWSVGMTVLEMTSGKAPFPTAAVAIYKVCVKNEIPSPPESLSQEAHHFLRLCFEFDPKTRPDAEKLRAHEFCDVTDDPSLLALPSGCKDDFGDEDSFSDDSAMIPTGESTEEASSRRRTKEEVNDESIDFPTTRNYNSVGADPFLSESTPAAGHAGYAEEESDDWSTEHGRARRKLSHSSQHSTLSFDDKNNDESIEEDLEDTFSDLEISLK